MLGSLTGACPCTARASCLSCRPGRVRFVLSARRSGLQRVLRALAIGPIVVSERRSIDRIEIFNLLFHSIERELGP